MIRHYLYLMVHHPAYVVRMMYRAIKVVIKLKIKKEAVTIDYIGGIRMGFDLSNPVIRDWYVGYPVEETLFYRKELKPGDVFIDVGASIGFISAIVASCVGTTGEVHSFEPLPQYYAKLAELASNNPDYHIITNQCALGDTTGTITINVPEVARIGGSTVVPGAMREESIRESIKVPLLRLDDYVKEKEMEKVSFVKIDVEGFEFPVLRGMELILKEYKPVILCEIIPRAYRLLDPNSSVDDLFKYMAKFHYEWHMLQSNETFTVIEGVFRYKEIG